ncbi:MAG: hypothetical protein AAGA75_11725 [Cyanobacteria bacterium P01_E01_bin.6]
MANEQQKTSYIEIAQSTHPDWIATEYSLRIVADHIKDAINFSLANVVHDPNEPEPEKYDSDKFVELEKALESIEFAIGNIQAFDARMNAAGRLEEEEEIVSERR